MNVRSVVQLLIIALCLAGVAGCGVSIDKPKGSTASVGANLRLKWPAGYSYDPATRKLARPSSFVRRDAPSYVTRVTLTVTGAEMDPISVDVPLDTLTVDLTLTFGERTFDVLVETESGDTFTGSVTMTVSPYESPVVEIELEVNAPPTITGIDISNYAPRPGETITVTGYAEDPDPDDTLTYTWYAYGISGSISGSDAAISVEVPMEGGQITVTLVVEDGYGGVAQAEQTIYVQGTPPVIVDMFASNTAPMPGDVVSLDGYATDEDPNDMQFYLWTIMTPIGEVFDIPGQTADFKITDLGQYVVILAVNDLQGNYAHSSMTIDVACNYPTPQAPTIVSVIPTGPGMIDVYYQYPGGPAGELVDGIAVYNLNWSESSAASGVPFTNSGWLGGYPMTGVISFNCTTGVYYSFEVSAGNRCFVPGLPSAPMPPTPSWVLCP